MEDRPIVAFSMAFWGQMWYLSARSLNYNPTLDEIENAAGFPDGRVREEMQKLIRDIERGPYSSALLYCVRSALG